ncbi:MAG: glycosyltransferase family 4 protein [Sulfurimonas sp.]|nr:glycosyltransferase family 4 protein [Sulfurimonas sp.]
MNKKTVIELCMSPDLGGLELNMITTAKLLQDDFNIISIINRNSKISKYYDETDKFIEIEKKSSFFMFGEAKQLANIIDKEDVKIIHFHWTKDIPFVVLAKLLSKSKPKIVQTRHMTMTRFKDDFYHKFLYKNIDLMIAITNQVREQLEKFIPSDIRPNIELLYAGVRKHEPLNEIEVNNLKSELLFSDKSFNIGMVGRINEPKGQHILIKAVDILTKKGLDINAYFVGHAMEESYLQKLKDDVKARGIEKQIHFLGFMKNPHHFYQICDGIVLASKRETFGLVLIEAMQMQTAVIGSNSGGVIEIIDDKENGLLFEAENDIDLADKINFMIDNPQKVKDMELSAFKKCEEYFNDKKQYNKLKIIFKKLI